MTQDLKVQAAVRVYREFRETPGLAGLKVHKESRGHLVLKGSQGLVVLPGRKALKAFRGLVARKEFRVSKAQSVPQGQ